MLDGCPRRGHKALWPKAHRERETAAWLCFHLWHIWDLELEEFLRYIFSRGEEEKEHPFSMKSGTWDVSTTHSPGTLEVTPFGWSPEGGLIASSIVSKAPILLQKQHGGMEGINKSEVLESKWVWLKSYLYQACPQPNYLTLYGETQFPHQQIRRSNINLAQLFWGAN